MNARVLIIDDVVCSRHLTKRGLEGLGHNIFDVGTPADALTVLGKEGVDLILVDLLMLGKPGFEQFNQAMRTSGIPIFALTASIDENLIKRAVLLGFKEVLRKPLNFQHLDALITKHCADANARQSNVSIRLPQSLLDAARVEARKANLPLEEFLGGVLQKVMAPAVSASEPQTTPVAQAAPETQSPAAVA